MEDSVKQFDRFLAEPGYSEMAGKSSSQVRCSKCSKKTACQSKISLQFITGGFFESSPTRSPRVR